jgi:light-regulated signal transduction histidine kinase (bacteriophytochrome)
MSAIVQHICDELKRDRDAAHIELDVPEGLEVFGDPRLLEIVFRNLLDNAFKFTSKREKPKVELGLVKGQDGNVYFIRDNGAGFNMEYADRLFGAFQRLHDQSDFSGTGVGLATVQRIIHRHNGRIWAESEPDKGTAFFFTV